MARHGTWLGVCMIVVLADFLVGSQISAAQAGSSQISDARTACSADVQRLCSGVPAGGGRILACLKQHKDQVSDGCKRAILAAMGGSSGGANSAASSAPASATPAYPVASPAAPESASSAPLDTGNYASSASTAASGSAGKSSSASKQKSRGSSTASLVSGEHYFVMKQVKIVDQGQGQGKPAYDLLIPRDWQFKGWVNVGVAPGGCFGDWFSVFGTADSPDKSIEFQMLPQSTWQYVDDPVGQQQMQKQNQSDMKYGMKACPVRAPVRAEQFLRQDIVAKCTTCKNMTVVSAEPFPELDEMTRHQLGLPPAARGGNTGNTRIDAARIRVAFDDDKGQPAESWIAAAIVVHTMPGGGRGASYDWHAMNVLFFRTPKGKLDANDRLFKMMISTIHPELEWQRQSNGVIASLYKKKQEELAKQAAMIAAFRQHVADVVNQVTANQIAGANQAANGQDQLVRGVQTFRDPATGETMELSNQYDHAWLNSSNEYVMSGDPNYNPNGDLNGSWNRLELVRPQP